MGYRITTQRELRRVFWRDHPDLPRRKITNYIRYMTQRELRPDLPRRKITNYSGEGKMHVTDVRCAFHDYIDMLSKDAQISPELADRATL